MIADAHRIREEFFNTIGQKQPVASVGHYPSFVKHFSFFNLELAPPLMPSDTKRDQLVHEAAPRIEPADAAPWARLTRKEKAASLVLAALLFGGCIYIGRLPLFVPGDFLSALAWKYSALLSVPIALLWLESGHKMHGPTGPGILFVPVFFYFLAAQLLLVVPRIAVSIFDYPKASQVVTVAALRHGTRTCGSRAMVELEEYSTFSVALCAPEALEKALAPAGKLRLEGKAGLGGLLLLSYDKL